MLPMAHGYKLYEEFVQPNVFIGSSFAYRIIKLPSLGEHICAMDRIDLMKVRIKGSSKTGEPIFRFYGIIGAA
jgi:hypothetical protein